MSRYRVKINGFQVYNQTADHIFEVDGRGDEIQIGVTTVVIGADGKTIGLPSARTTPIMGDISKHDNKILAGTAGSLGGLRTSDSYPTTVMPWNPPVPTSPARDYPPYVVWEGDLPDDGRGLILTPAMIEYDPGGPDVWSVVSGFFKQIDDAFGARAKAAFGTLFPVAAPVFDAVSVGIQTAASLPRFLGTPGARPIGMVPAPDDPSKYVYPPKVVVLTAKVAQEVVVSDSGHGPGIFSIPFRDDAGLGGGHYELYLQVEAVDGAPPSFVHVGHANRVRSMTALGTTLLAVTDDRTLWQRSTAETDVPWTAIGVAPAGARLAVVDPLIFCAGDGNALYFRGDPQVGAWQHIGHANNVTAMTAAGDGRLHCTTADGSLWSREPIPADVPWQRLAGGSDAVALASNGPELFRATRDGKLWRRHVGGAGGPWQQFATAPVPVTALAWASGLWMATSDDKLWKVRL